MTSGPASAIALHSRSSDLYVSDSTSPRLNKHFTIFNFLHEKRSILSTRVNFYGFPITNLKGGEINACFELNFPDLTPFSPIQSLLHDASVFDMLENSQKNLTFPLSTGKRQFLFVYGFRALQHMLYPTGIRRRDDF